MALLMMDTEPNTLVSVVGYSSVKLKANLVLYKVQSSRNFAVLH